MSVVSSCAGHLAAKEAEKKARFNQAKEAGELKECGCCFDDEILPEDLLSCPSGHSFCTCVRSVL